MLRHHRRTAVSSECCRYRLVTGTRRSDHISPVMIRQLHWLPVRRHRVVFNIATLVYRSLSGNSAGYLSARRRRPCQTTAFCRHSNTCCQQQFWRQDLCRCGTTSLEQSAVQSQTMRAFIPPVRAVTEDIFIRTVRPWHSSVNCF